VRGCIACLKCFEKRNGRCIVEKDDMNDYLEQIYAADAAKGVSVFLDEPKGVYSVHRGGQFSLPKGVSFR
jgi:hypothetical protein